MLRDFFPLRLRLLKLCVLEANLRERVEVHVQVFVSVRVRGRVAKNEGAVVGGGVHQ